MLHDMDVLTEIQALRQDVQELKLLMSGNTDATWLSEEKAAAMLGYTARGLRRKVKTNEYPFSLIKYRCTNNRSYQYSKKTIEKFKERTFIPN